MKKRKKYPQKRKKFWELLLRSLCVSTLLSVIFGFQAMNYLDHKIREECGIQLRERIANIQRDIMTAQKKYKGELCMQEISLRMAMYSYYDVVIDDPLDFKGNRPVQITPYYSPDCYVASEIIDENNNVVASNRQKLISFFSFGKGDKDNALYTCDNEALKMQEIEDIYNTYNNFKDINDGMNYIDMEMTSAYVNKKAHTFIPNKMHMEVYQFDDIYDQNGQKMLDRSFEITIDDDDYELIELKESSKEEYPKKMLFSFQGFPQSDMKLKTWEFRRDESSIGGYHYNDDLYIIDGNINVTIEGKDYTLYVGFVVNTKEPQLVRLFWKWTLTFAAVVTMIAVLFAWRKNVINKAQYAFEDYQRALTNNLAHDIKTPLAVIGGYAENLIEMRKGSADEKELNYLSSIMDNVAYTDNIVASTLQLSRTEQIKKLNKKKVDIKALAEKLVEKYRTALEERDIELKIDGSSEVIADEEILSSAVENLISNAVKYTRDGGAINITVSKKGFNIVNDVVENIDTKDLLMPFVKGDKARSDKRSSGLGLAIASAAAAQNGFTLKIECKDKKFRAAIDY